MTNTRKMNNMTAVSVGSYGSVRKMMEAAALKGNAKDRVLKCGKTYCAAGTDRREIRARLKTVLGDQLTGLTVSYDEVETVSRGRKTGKTHIVGTVSLTSERKQAAETRKAAETVTKPVADLEADVCSLMSENKRLADENAVLKARLTELSAALEMLSAHAVK